MKITIQVFNNSNGSIFVGNMSFKFLFLPGMFCIYN